LSKKYFFFYADSEPESGIFLTLDRGFRMENSDPASGMNILDSIIW
jgi:hypothetical protein